MDRLTLFKIGFLPISLMDVVDLLAVAFIFYQIFILVRGTRAAQMILGLLVLFGASAMAALLRMNSLSWLLGKVQTIWVFGLIVLFQPELRRMLIRLGQSRAIRFLLRPERTRVVEEIEGVDAVAAVDEVVTAAQMLSQRGYGGLIVMVRDVGIASVIETGIGVHAEVSAMLIMTIFEPHTPLHDGALVIQGGLVEAAKCILPLTQNPHISPSMGTRHRAALGLSEESDAVIVVVSEETQQISLAVNGEFTRHLSPAALRENLVSLLGHR